LYSSFVQYIPLQTCYLRAATDIFVWTSDVNAETLCQLRKVPVSCQFVASCISFHQTISRVLNHSSCNMQLESLRCINCCSQRLIVILTEDITMCL